MEGSGGARPGETMDASGRAESAERRAAPESRVTRGMARRHEQSRKSTSRRDVDTSELSSDHNRDHTTHTMQCRVIYRGTIRHHYNRMREADLMGRYETHHNFYQIQPAPAGETATWGIRYTHSTREPPSRGEEKNMWTRSDSEAVRRHEAEKMRPEHTVEKFMATTMVWMQEVSPVVQHEVQERRIRRYLWHDIAIEMGDEAAVAMHYQVSMWTGGAYQWAVKIPARLREAYTVVGFIILPAYHTYPATRLDVYDFVTKPLLPVSDHVTGHYPPFSQERLSGLVKACDRWSAGDASAGGVIVDRAQGKMQGWFRMPRDSVAGRWWALIEGGAKGGSADGAWARIAKEEGELVTEPWIEVDGPGWGGASG